MVNRKLAAVKLGIEKTLAEPSKFLGNLRVGLICNQASVNHDFAHSADVMFENSEINLSVLFGPQHGIRGDVQDNMVETKHGFDKKTKLPIYSLYSETRKPTEEMISNLDALVFDLQDVGCRVYTFIYTMAYAMQACAEFGKKFIVCDRPNPINGIDVEGNLLEKGQESFVGQYPIPMRHGLTVGELAKFFNEEFAINCELEVITMDGWSRDFYMDETDAPWVMPSPNMPTIDSTVVFPGTVYFEGTQVSEGRGTTRPFEMIGAPYIDADELVDALRSFELGGVTFRAVNFIPTFQKHAGEVCGGVFLHITDRNAFEPVIAGITLIKTIYNKYRNEFKWKNPPYEYEFTRNPFDVIAGTERIREYIENDFDIRKIKLSWRDDLNFFKEQRSKYLLY